MKRFVAVTAFVLLVGCAGSNGSGLSDGKQLRYNTVEDRYEYVGERESLRYNHVEDRYEYAGTNEKLRYNTVEREYSYE